MYETLTQKFQLFEIASEIVARGWSLCILVMEIKYGACRNVISLLNTSALCYSGCWQVNKNSTAKTSLAILYGEASFAAAKVMKCVVVTNDLINLLEFSNYLSILVHMLQVQDSQSFLSARNRRNLGLAPLLRYLASEHTATKKIFRSTLVNITRHFLQLVILTELLHL